jgi:hypothetical protein
LGNRIIHICSFALTLALSQRERGGFVRAPKTKTGKNSRKNRKAGFLKPDLSSLY